MLVLSLLDPVQAMSPSGDLDLQLDPDDTANMVSSSTTISGAHFNKEVQPTLS